MVPAGFGWGHVRLAKVHIIEGRAVGGVGVLFPGHDLHRQSLTLP